MGPLRMAFMFLISWVYAQSVGSFVSPGPLAAPHAELDTITQCFACHSPLKGVDPGLCLGCHDRVRHQVENRSGFHANKGNSCEVCHADHRGRDAGLIRLEEDSFDHSETGFELTGEHANLACDDCHLPEKDWADIEPACVSCHRQVHGTEPSKGGLLERCEACHLTGGWRTETIPKTVFDHTDARFTDYPLTGKHVDVACRSCHFDFRFLPTEHDGCTTCHEDPHRAFHEPCTGCHPEPTSWRVPGFDHGQTGYRLEGLHAEVACDGCHRSIRTLPVAHDGCEDCHEDLHRGQFAPRTCDACHTVTVADFALRDFDHDQASFPLRGAHRERSCEDCHGDGAEATYLPLAHEDCASCHEDVHEGRFSPTPCKVCHAETSWDVEDFDHDRTRFPLTGQHVDVPCEGCHTNHTYRGLPFDSCGGCHQETPHDAALTRPCDGCHRTTGFAEMVFAHARETGFDLGLNHRKIPCTDCHERLEDFGGVAGSQCVDCHDERRPRGHYRGDCAGCHAGPGWSPATLGDRDHAITGFALRGLHALLPCTSCHPAGQARGATPSDCAGCHRQDDPHRNLLGNRCDDCHDERGWFRTRFRHANTGWPLLGLHRVVECNDCHALGFIGTPTRCQSCHEAGAPMDVEAHRSPFFADCESCHSPYAWEATRYAH